MLIIVKLELGETKRKVMVEAHVGNEDFWLVGYLPISDDAERLKIEFDMMGVLKFEKIEDAMTAFENYSI